MSFLLLSLPPSLPPLHPHFLLHSRFTEPPVLNMAQVVDDSTCSIPLIFVLSAGVVSAHLIHLSSLSYFFILSFHHSPSIPLFLYCIPLPVFFSSCHFIYLPTLPLAILSLHLLCPPSSYISNYPPLFPLHFFFSPFILFSSLLPRIRPQPSSLWLTSLAWVTGSRPSPWAKDRHQLQRG